MTVILRERKKCLSDNSNETLGFPQTFLENRSTVQPPPSPSSSVQPPSSSIQPLHLSPHPYPWISRCRDLWRWWDEESLYLRITFKSSATIPAVGFFKRMSSSSFVVVWALGGSGSWYFGGVLSCQHGSLLPVYCLQICFDVAVWQGGAQAYQRSTTIKPR